MQTPWRKLYVLSFAGALSWLGSSLSTFAVILRDKDHVGAAGVSLYLLAFTVPSIFMAPMSGLIADKFSSRQVILPALTIMGLSSASLATDLPLWWTPIALLITACAGTFVGPSMQAVQVVVTAPEDLPRVSGLMQSMSAAGMLFAPALGGILVSTTGYFWPFVIDAISFWLLALAFLAINLNRKPVEHKREERLSALAGLKFVFSDRLIRALVILVAVLIISLSSFNVGEVFLVKDELKASTFIFGIISAMFPAGSIVGSVLTAAIKLPTQRHALATIAGIATIIFMMLGLSLATEWWMALVFSFFAGVGNSGLNAYAMSIIMTRSPKEALGRVNAAIGAVIQTGGALGIVIAGAAIAAFSVRPVMLVGGLVSLVILAVFGPEVLRAGKHHRENAETNDEVAPA
ncbi:MAG: MFS transporter [Micrococcales bacterium]